MAQGAAGPKPPSMGGREWAMLVALSVLWGGSFFFNGVAVRELPSLTLVWLRVSIATVALLPAAVAAGERMPAEGRVWRAFFVVGLLSSALPFALIAWGQHRITSGLASVLNATTPLFGVLVAHLLTKDEKLTALKGAGIATGFAGVAVMVGPQSIGGNDGNLLPQLACLTAALCYAFAGIFGRRFRVLGVGPIATAAGQVSASAVLLLPAVLLVDRPWTLAMPHAATWGAMLGTGLLSTALAFVLYFRILASAGATNVLLVTFLIPVSATVLGVFALGETLLPLQLSGMALIGAGLACVDGRLPHLLLRRMRPAPSRQ